MNAGTFDCLFKQGKVWGIFDNEMRNLFVWNVTDPVLFIK